MDVRRPLSRRRRWLLHLAYAASALAALGYLVRLAGEPHAARGVFVPSDGIVSHVAAGSAAQAAGVVSGDTLAAGEALRWRDGPTPPSLRVLREAREVALAIEARAPPLARRLAMLPGYRWVLLGVGLATLAIGWWVVALNPDAPGTVPFVLWTATAALVFPMIGPSRLWSAEMWETFVVWESVFNGLYQAFTLHWLLLFPRRLGGRRVVWALYGTAFAGIAWLLAMSLGPFQYPEAALHGRAAIVGVLVLALSAVQFARAPTRRVRRQASWVLLAAATYTVLDIALWELPVLLDVRIGSTGAVNALVGLGYLVIPAGIAVAVTREGLFGIDRFVTPGLATGVSLVLLAVGYAAGAAVLSTALGARGALPIGLGVALAVALAAFVVPLQRGMLRVLGRVFDRHERQARETLAAFEAAAAAAAEPLALRDALAAALRDGLGASPCTVSDEPLAHVAARPGVLDVSAADDIRLDSSLDVALAVPLPGGRGHVRLGLRADGARFHDDHLALVGDLGRRYGLALERLRLVRRLSARELDLAHTRLRIAGDLHDDIGASLSSMAVLSDLVRRNDALPPADRARLDRLSASARDLVGDLRDIVWSIDPGSDRVHDLAERLRDTCAALLPGLRCTVEAPEAGDLPLGMETRRQLLLVAKEALHNAARHAGATTVQIHLDVPTTPSRSASRTTGAASTRRPSAPGMAWAACPTGRSPGRDGRDREHARRRHRVVLRAPRGFGAAAGERDSASRGPRETARSRPDGGGGARLS